MIGQLVAKAFAESSSLVDDGQITLNPIEGVGSVSELLNRVLPWISLAAGAIAFAYLLYSGFMYLTAGGNAEAAKKGQQGILNAVIGLIIIALAYTITTALIGTFNSGS